MNKVNFRRNKKRKKLLQWKPDKLKTKLDFWHKFVSLFDWTWIITNKCDQDTLHELTKNRYNWVTTMLVGDYVRLNCSPPRAFCFARTSATRPSNCQQTRQEPISAVFVSLIRLLNSAHFQNPTSIQYNSIMDERKIIFNIFHSLWHIVGQHSRIVFWGYLYALFCKQIIFFLKLKPTIKHINKQFHFIINILYIF